MAFLRKKRFFAGVHTIKTVINRYPAARKMQTVLMFWN